MKEVEFMPTREAVQTLKTSYPALVKAILNGTLPIGFVIPGENGKKATIKIIKARFEKWLNGEF